jgi:hypothetical protein
MLASMPVTDKSMTSAGFSIGVVTTITVFSSGLLDFPAEGLVINRVESRNVNPKNCSDLS